MPNLEGPKTEANSKYDPNLTSGGFSVKTNSISNLTEDVGIDGERINERKNYGSHSNSIIKQDFCMN